MSPICINFAFHPLENVKDTKHAALFTVTATEIIDKFSTPEIFRHYMQRERREMSWIIKIKSLLILLPSATMRDSRGAQLFGDCSVY